MQKDSQRLLEPDRSCCWHYLLTFRAVFLPLEFTLHDKCRTWRGSHNSRSAVAEVQRPRGARMNAQHQQIDRLTICNGYDCLNGIVMELNQYLGLMAAVMPAGHKSYQPR